jgi:hypothetical protein
LRRCAFFSSAATRLRSARSFACSFLNVVMPSDNDCIIPVPLGPPNRNWEVIAATWESALLPEALADPLALERSLQPQVEAMRAELNLVRSAPPPTPGCYRFWPKTYLHVGVATSGTILGSLHLHDQQPALVVDGGKVEHAGETVR